MAVLGPAPVLCFGPHLPRRHLQQSEWASTLKSREYHPVTEALARLLAGRRAPVSSSLASITCALTGCWHSAKSFAGSASSSLHTDPVTEVQLPS